MTYKVLMWGGKKLKQLHDTTIVTHIVQSPTTFGVLAFAPMHAVGKNMYFPGSTHQNVTKNSRLRSLAANCSSFTGLDSSTEVDQGEGL
jgi:hypothetical protein